MKKEEKRKQHKALLVEEWGGRCQLCGYAGCMGALQFHHVDPETKEFSLSKRQVISMERLRQEALKCVLLCANCHFEVEAGLISPELVASLQRRY